PGGHMRSIKPFLFCIILQLIILNTVLAEAPPSEPILRIDTGMHTAPISRIGVDRNERFIVTGSNDKTFSEIKNTVSSIAGKVAMFVDTCHSGGVMGKRAITDITGVINELTSAENGVVVFASSTGRQYSLEDPQWQNGAFTKAVIEGIAGKADLLGKGKITVNMLDAFIAERVKEITNGKQTPVTTKPNTVPDFPIAVR
ncbi:MAG TPA: caspase family protein, partial [Syntrophorhabdaceae bacterium]|nr:caspase family protein [Syntrophorhabdaceae bacterium]